MFSKNSIVNFDKFNNLVDELGDLLYTNAITLDSRKVTAGSIFCAYPGSNSDGRLYIQQAIDNGAQLILWESDENNCGAKDYAVKNYAVKNYLLKNDVTKNYVVKNYSVKNLMLYVGLLAAAKYGYPTRKFKTIGVTGTNGKTSITHWLNQVYKLTGKTTGIIGTMGAGIYPDITDYQSTTPNPITLQAILADMAKNVVDMAALEVSSHALHQGRVNGISFTTAIFTNLTQDHLDYHKDMENYYLAKRELFFWHGLENAIINVDDEYGKRLAGQLVELQNTPVHSDAEQTQNNVQDYNNKYNTDKDIPLNVLTYGIDNGELTANDIKITLGGTFFILKFKDEAIECTVPVIGKFNVYNLLAVAGALLVDGYKLPEIAKLLAQLSPVCGRMETLIFADKPLVAVDYSHTPDSLKNALLTLKEIEHTGKLYCVFGCGGNRDKLKRPIMGKIATQIADYTVITSDNPRYEEPGEIIAQVVAGIESDNTSCDEHNKYEVIALREEAISHVLKLAKAGDIVLIAGKGHETYQEIQGVKYAFSDVAIAENILLS